MTVRAYPPGPKGHLLRGHLPDFRRDRLEFFTRCARDWGDVVALRFAHRRVFLLSHPTIIEEVLVAQNHHFIKHFALRLNPLVLGRGLLTSAGDFWLGQRRLIQPVFLKSRIASYAPCMVQATTRMLDAWSAGQTRDIHEAMMGLTLEIAAKTLFDADAAGAAGEVGPAMQLLQENFLVRFASLVPLPLWIPTPTNLRVRRAIRRLDAILYGFIRERRQLETADNRDAKSSERNAPPADQGDLLSLLLQAQDEQGRRMTDRQLRDEAMTLFLAGHETTALALSWTWYLLARHPEAQARLRAEVDHTLQGRLPTVADLPRLRYCERVITESMRLYPPAYVIGREAIHDCTIAGYPVPRGTTLLMCEWVVHRDPRFFDQPDEFRPERWDEDKIKQLPKFAYFPFGGGPRLCIGNTFAMMEMVLVMATIAQRFRFTLKPEPPVEPWATFTLRPRHGIWATLERVSEPVK